MSPAFRPSTLKSPCDSEMLFITEARSIISHAPWSKPPAFLSTKMNTSFPICNCAKDYKSVARSRVKGLGKTCCEILDRIEPYKGGSNHRLWQLNELDVIDKHRMLVAVATVPIGRS